MTKAPRRTRSPPKATAEPRYLPNLIVTCLAPMFFPVCGGDINHARMVAIETVKAYRIEGRADLIVIARIIGFSLAALGCLLPIGASSDSRDCCVVPASGYHR